MPTTLQIKDFGPLKLVNIELKKFNIIIGPQSSGKSCILKVAAFCKYVESLICSRRSGQHGDKAFINSRFIDYYKLDGFVNSGTSEIMYDSDRCKVFITFSNNKGRIAYVEKTNDLYESNVRYVPAERSVVSIISNLLNLYKLMPNNISSHYVSDWNSARQSIDHNNSLGILDLGMSYYYDKDKDQDILVVDNNTEIVFGNASSGLQSIVPICLLINYYLSPKIQADNTTEDQLKNLLNSNDLTDDTKEQLRKLLLISSKKKWKEILPCDIFLEEPEISIFPETQYELVKWIVNKMDSNGEDNSIFIATHSPYVLSSFNNLIYYGNVIEENPSIKDELASYWNNINPITAELFSAYAINSKSECSNLIDVTTKIIGNNPLDSTFEKMGNDFDFMYSKM